MSSIVLIPATYIGAQQMALSYLLKNGFEFSCVRRGGENFSLTVFGFDDMVVRNEMGRAGLSLTEFEVVPISPLPAQTQLLDALSTAGDVLAHARHFYSGGHSLENFTLALEQIASAQRAAGVAPIQFE